MFSDSERTSFLPTSRITQVQAIYKLGNTGTQKGLRVHAILAFHWLEGNLNQHVTERMMAPLEAGLVGTCGRARVTGIPFNHFLSCSKVNKMLMQRRQFIISTCCSFQHVFNTCYTPSIGGTGSPETKKTLSLALTTLYFNQGRQGKTNQQLQRNARQGEMYARRFLETQGSDTWKQTKDKW